MAKRPHLTYRQAGVDIDEADRAVASIRRMARATFTPGVLTEIGGFGGCFQVPRMKEPVLVSSVDGVGTKLKLAFITGRHDTVGEDLVNHCVNDIAVGGAVPLFFLDYLAVGKLRAEVAVAIVEGMARGCKRNGCALIGGETAEMPGMYAEGEYDLAGTVVGVAEKSKLLSPDRVEEGDLLLGFASTGLHTNGYSLARKLLFEVAHFGPDTHVDELGRSVADELLTVHRSYLRPLRALHDAGLLRAAAHITGGGIPGNLPRALPKTLGAQIDSSAWTVPPIFELLRKLGDVPDDDWRRTFNLGIGLIAIVRKSAAAKAKTVLAPLREKPIALGFVTRQKRNRPRVEFV